MLSNQHRLSRSQIALITKKGQKHTSPSTVLFIDRTIKGKKYAVIVSKKVSKRAVRRNYLKRAIRHIIASHLPNTVDGTGCVVVCRRDSSVLDFKTLKNEITETLSSANVLKQ